MWSLSLQLNLGRCLFDKCLFPSIIGILEFILFTIHSEHSRQNRRFCKVKLSSNALIICRHASLLTLMQDTYKSMRIRLHWKQVAISYATWSSIKCDPAWKNRAYVHKIHSFILFYLYQLVHKLYKFCKLHEIAHCVLH